MLEQAVLVLQQCAAFSALYCYFSNVLPFQHRTATSALSCHLSIVLLLQRCTATSALYSHLRTVPLFPNLTASTALHSCFIKLCIFRALQFFSSCTINIQRCLPVADTSGSRINTRNTISPHSSPVPPQPECSATSCRGYLASKESQECNLAEYNLRCQPMLW